MMDFPCEAFFSDDSPDDAPIIDKAATARASYRPRICSNLSMTVHTSDENSVKMSADYHYFLEDYGRAKLQYKQVLDTPGINRSAAVRRDVVEGIARSCIKLGDLKEAKEFSDKLYSSSLSSNVDHMTVSISLQLDIAVASLDVLFEEYWLRRLIELHSLVPRYWIQLGKGFKKKDKMLESYCCVVRAAELLRAVQRSVGSFAKDNNVGMKEIVEDELIELGIFDKTYDDVKSAITCDIFGTGDADTGDFQDLGRSARLKKIEDEFAEKEADESGDEDVFQFIARFNKKWFSSVIHTF